MFFKTAEMCKAIYKSANSAVIRCNQTGSLQTDLTQGGEDQFEVSMKVTLLSCYLSRTFLIKTSKEGVKVKLRKCVFVGVKVLKY